MCPESDHPTILRIAVPVHLWETFDYLPPADVDPAALCPGLRVEAPFGRRNLQGMVMEVVRDSDIDPARLRPVHAVLDREPLLREVDMQLLRWASRYYHHPIGEVVATALAAPLRRGESSQLGLEKRLFVAASHPAENPAVRPPKPTSRQKALLQLLADSPEGLTPPGLAVRGFDTRTCNSLVGKRLAEWREISNDSLAMRKFAQPLRLNPQQEEAVAAVRAALGGFAAFLLEGITGSGKTEVYLHLVAEVVARGQQALVLVPEISLTPQLEARFRARLTAPMVVFHSGLSDEARQRAWLAMQRGEASILLGTRSAVFTPMRHPGLILLDEEHDGSFKQQERFRFSARDVAVMRASLEKVPILLGSATPSLESLYNAEQGRYRHLRLTMRAGGAAEPGFRLVDIRGLHLREGISPVLAGRIAETLERGEQALLFVNRRGFAPTLICHACGWVAQCRHCDANLVIHYGDNQLRCHHCGYLQVLPQACSQCGKTDLRPLGLGTERVESALAEMFPDKRIARLDRDSTRRKGQLEQVLENVREGRVDLLIGTQMLAKGHHFPGVTLVGIVNVDAGLFSTDFRAGEHTAQLIMQVAGRAGREERPGLVLLQTRHPEHPQLQRLVGAGYAACARELAQDRREAGLPPYAYQALWRAEARVPDPPSEFLGRIAVETQRIGAGQVLALGPVPAPLTRRAGQMRFQLLLQAPRRKTLHRLLDGLLQNIAQWPESGKLRWSLDVDPMDLY